MTQHYTNPSSEPRLRDTLRDDLHQAGFVKKIRAEFNEIQDFYVSEEKRILLDSMPWYKKWFILFFWLLKSMLLKLTPARRLLIILASIMIIINGVEITSDNTTVSTNWDILGLAIFVFVLMLELKDRILARSELAAGRTLQRALMPEQFPKFEGWSVALHTEPANEVGGDLVDFIPITSSTAVVVLGDVSGKGLKAAMMMAKLQTIIRVLMFDHTETALPFQKLNKIFKRETVTGMFASLLFTELSSGTNTIRYINAGHLPPLLITHNGITELPKGDCALGIMDEPQYNEQQLTANSGDIFIAFSDGVIEAQNTAKEQFGLERVKKFLLPMYQLPVSEIGRRLMIEVSSFVGNAHPHDDLSFVIIKKI